MKKSIIAVVLAAGICGGVFNTNAEAAETTGDAAASAAAGQPWQNAQTIVRAVEADLPKSGIRSAQPHVAELEQSLAEADHPFGPAPQSGDRILLADGATQAAAAVIYAAADKSPEAAGRKAVTLANPYPSVSLYLGSYYNDVGKHADALRVLDRGLALPGPVPGMPAAADHLPFLINERGVALNALKQWPESVANFDKGLAIVPLADRVRALLLRGRGFALTELGRLDEAEKSYRDSLISEPNNARALGELNYIARIRAGGAPAATIIVPAQTPAQ